MKSQQHQVKNLRYISEDNLGLAALLIYKGCRPLGKACVEGEHYFLFEETDSLISVLATYGYEDEALVQGSAFYKILQQLQLDVEDETL